jgi:hypothetical protein
MLEACSNFSRGKSPTAPEAQQKVGKKKKKT